MQQNPSAPVMTPGPSPFGLVAGLGGNVLDGVVAGYQIKSLFPS